MRRAVLLVALVLCGCASEGTTGPQWARVEVVCTMTAQPNGQLVDRCEGVEP